MFAFRSGAELVVLSDMYDAEELGKFVGVSHPVWIGANRLGVADDDSTTLKWNSVNSSVYYGFWDAFQPDWSLEKRCVESRIARNTEQWGFYKPNTHLWAFASCTELRHYVCQIQACAKGG